MAEILDIKLDADFDLMISAGDFVVDDVTKQNQELILISQKGMWKQTPVFGIAISDYLLDDSDRVTLNGSIQEQFSSDGMKVRKITTRDLANITVDAIYENN